MTDTPRNFPSLAPADVSSLVVYRGFSRINEMRFRLTKFDGTQTPHMTREIYDRGNAVAVLPYDPVSDRVLMIRGFLAGAFAAGRPNCPPQVIAGMIDDDEPAEVAARREAEEEAGLKISHLMPAQNFLPSPGGSAEYILTYLAFTDLSEAGGYFGVATENEDIQAFTLSAEEAIALLDAGDIEAGPAVVLMSWFARHHERLRREGLAREWA